MARKPKANSRERAWDAYCQCLNDCWTKLFAGAASDYDIELIQKDEQGELTIRRLWPGGPFAIYDLSQRRFWEC
jgi:hypothetical protein